KIERQMHLLSRLNVGEEVRKRIAGRLLARDQRLQDEDDKLHLHPFPDFVSRHVPLTGYSANKIPKAAIGDIGGHIELVAELRKLDGTPELGRLYSDLLRDHPELAAKLRVNGVPAAAASLSKTQAAATSVARKDRTTSREEADLILHRLHKA